MCANREAIHVASVTQIVMKATTRLPNSTYEWKPCSGNGWFGAHPGQ